MSVRKVYDVLVDGNSVFSGSYRACLYVYESFSRYADFLNPEDVPVVVLAVKPDLKFNDDDGGFLNV